MNARSARNKYTEALAALDKLAQAEVTDSEQWMREAWRTVALLRQAQAD